VNHPLTSRPWWQDAVIYEIYPRSFADGNNDGTGDLKGITSKLDYLRFTLGVDAIWICPFYGSPMADLGYDIRDHTAIAPVFGTMGDFEKLLTQARRRDLRVIVDFVPDRTSDQHPWFLSSRLSRDDPKRDWYIWADPTPDGAPPSDWTDQSGQSCWEYHWASDQYYLHSFHRRLPLLNWHNPEVRRAMLDVLSFWLDKGVDGVHIDIAHTATASSEPHGAANPRHLIGRHPADGAKQLTDHLSSGTHICLQTIRLGLESHSRRTGHDVVAIDHDTVTPHDHQARFFNTGTGPHLPFNPVLARATWTAAGLAGGIEAAEATLPAKAWPHHALSHNNRPRLTTTVGTHNARIAAMLMLTLRGTPTLYYGDELGLPDLLQDRRNRLDPLGRDRFRAPMAWTGAPRGGFSKNSTVQPWLPLTEPIHHYNVESQLADPGSLLNLYRRLIALRRRVPALRIGEYVTVSEAPPSCLCFLRTTGAQTILVAVNLDDQPHELDLPNAGRVLADTTGLPPADTFVKHKVLEPRNGAVIELHESL